MIFYQLSLKTIKKNFFICIYIYFFILVKRDKLFSVYRFIKLNSYLLLLFAKVYYNSIYIKSMVFDP